MKIFRWLFLLVFCLSGFAVNLHAQKGKHHKASMHQMRKDWLFKVDPLSGIFYEFRFSYEKKLKESLFFYASPSFLRRIALKDLQRHFGGGFRTGARWYFFSDYPPQGFFFQLAGGFQIKGIGFQDESSLQIVDRLILYSPGGGASVGYQWLFGTKMNFVVGFQGGVEYYQDFRSKPALRPISGYWYQLPILTGLRVNAGIELGFAFRQKNLHW